MSTDVLMNNISQEGWATSTVCMHAWWLQRLLQTDCPELNTGPAKLKTHCSKLNAGPAKLRGGTALGVQKLSRSQMQFATLGKCLFPAPGWSNHRAPRALLRRNHMCKRQMGKQASK